MKKIAVILVWMTFALGGTAYAHSDAFFDANPSPHGGQIRMAGAYHFELLVAESALTVYVTDHADQPIATAGATAVAVVSGKNNKIEVKFQPAGDNLLKGEGKFELDSAMRVKLTVTMSGAKPEIAKFRPVKAKMTPAKP